ncbi:MAG: hypothetical protein ACREPM_06580 [Gemmatimonadaceae bacterium]
MLRRCLILATFLAAPSVAQAQFATFIPPKPKVPDSVAAIQAAAQKTRADSATAARIRNMKMWVDSAAGLPPRPSRGADTVLMPTDTTEPPVLVATAQRPATPAKPEKKTETRPETRPETQPATKAESAGLSGSRAPATASDLPLLILVGALALVVGVLLIVGAPRTRDRA